MTKLLTVLKSKWFIAIFCLVLGAVLILGIRFASYKVEAIHYHANFAVYINGQKEDFKNPKYYTEVEMCSVDREVVPTERAHMHDNVNNVAHVEDHAVTWGQFFTNLGWIIGPTSIVSPDGNVYTNNGDNQLHIVLNSDEYLSMAGIQNVVIKDADKLLVSYGSETSSNLQKEYRTIPTTAKKYDKTKDPASCSGGHKTTIRDRLDHMF